jgi:hypothetical protein
VSSLETIRASAGTCLWHLKEQCGSKATHAVVKDFTRVDSNLVQRWLKGDVGRNIKSRTLIAFLHVVGYRVEEFEALGASRQALLLDLMLGISDEVDLAEDLRLPHPDAVWPVFFPRSRVVPNEVLSVAAEECREEVEAELRAQRKLLRLELDNARLRRRVAAAERSLAAVRLTPPEVAQDPRFAAATARVMAAAIALFDLEPDPAMLRALTRDGQDANVLRKQLGALLNWRPPKNPAQS